MAAMAAAPWVAKTLLGLSAASTAATVVSARKSGKTPAQPPVIERPDMEQIKLARRKAEASRLGSGRASTIMSQGGSGTLGPSG